MPRTGRSEYSADSAKAGLRVLGAGEIWNRMVTPGQRRFSGSSPGRSIVGPAVLGTCIQRIMSPLLRPTFSGRLLRLREAIGRQAHATEISDEIDRCRSEAMEAVDAYFKRVLAAVPSIETP